MKKLFLVTALTLFASQSYAQLELLPIDQGVLQTSKGHNFERKCKGYLYDKQNRVMAITADGYDLHLNLKKHGAQNFGNTNYGSDFKAKPMQEISPSNSKYDVYFGNYSSPFTGGAYLRHLKKVNDKTHLVELKVVETASKYSSEPINESTHTLTLNENCKHQKEGSMFYIKSKLERAVVNGLGAIIRN
ncbi:MULTISPECIES: hypothetical protein [Acinetobacter]|uniref:hypothetical protein n=1 Tax=Acinetobacter TaxID=469 RepID=UPI0015D16842|nr:MULTISPECIES: hypothetical protein [Acinetobacter]UNT61820.1 hypothetical protein IHE36_13155 [Acinetobacter towneri]